MELRTSEEIAAMRPRPMFLAALFAAAAGCADHARRTAPGPTTTISAMSDIPFHDQRNVTTRPVAAGVKTADVVVHVRHVKLPGGGGGAAMSDPTVVPTGGTLIEEAETFATFGTPFYCTTLDGEKRIELGGRLRRDGDVCSASIDYSAIGRGSSVGVKTSRLVKVGQTVKLLGCTDGTAVMLTLEPVLK
jgi:hypothetical protein